jgi:predicted DCC family thiol-disulfide oxidoreductase YuxK
MAMNESITGKEIEKPVLLFDGYCNLCSGSVIFIIKREKRDIFRFASLQSEFAKELLSKLNSRDDIPDSTVLVEANEVYYKSKAALKVARRLKFPWPLLYIFIIIPPFFRDWLYDFIAKRRYRWFGKKQHCFVPQKDIQHKFLSE